MNEKLRHTEFVTQQLLEMYMYILGYNKNDKTTVVNVSPDWDNLTNQFGVGIGTKIKDIVDTIGHWEGSVNGVEVSIMKEGEWKIGS